jgi:hypothetical protein
MTNKSLWTWVVKHLLLSVSIGEIMHVWTKGAPPHISTIDRVYNTEYARMHTKADSASAVQDVRTALR